MRYKFDKLEECDAPTKQTSMLKRGGVKKGGRLERSRKERESSGQREFVETNHSDGKNTTELNAAEDMR